MGNRTPASRPSVLRVFTVANAPTSWARPAALCRATTTALSFVICLALLGCSEEQPPEAAKQPEFPADQIVRTVWDTTATCSFNQWTPDTCKRMLQEWSSGRPYEKLAFAEGLLYRMRDKGPCENLEGYKWEQGTDDLSLPVARGKWALEHLLGVEFGRIVEGAVPPEEAKHERPNAPPESGMDDLSQSLARSQRAMEHSLGLGFRRPVKRTISLEEVKRVHEQAVRFVEAYRRELIERSSRTPLPAWALGDLKLRYRDRFTVGYSEKWDESAGAMVDLFDEWPPIGKKYEDLVSIVGSKAEPFWDEHLCYKFVGGHSGSRYYFRVKEGVIRSMGRVNGD